MRFLLVLVLGISACSPPPKVPKPEAVPLVLHPSLETDRERLQSAVDSARTALRAFAESYGWGEWVKEEFMDSVMVFDDKALFDKALLTLSGADTSMQLPPTYFAALERRVLIVMSPGYCARVYPEGNEPGSYPKLLAHEMAHRLHIRILGGNEEAMGPTWFFEGFAIFAAGQFADSPLQLSNQEVVDVLSERERGSYLRYNYCFRYFVNQSDLKTLVVHAGRPGFSDSLIATNRKNAERLQP